MRGPRPWYDAAIGSPLGNAVYEPCFRAFDELGFFEVALPAESDFMERLRPMTLPLVALSVAVVGFPFALFLIVASRERVGIIRERERYFRRVFEKVKMLVVGIDLDGRILFANDFLCGWSGYRRDEVIAKNWYELFLPPESAIRESIPALFDDIDVSCRIEDQAYTASGEVRTVAWTRTANYDAEGRVSGITLIGEDVTEKRRQEEMTAKAIKEKELLLREVHHRVKNNLQLISSLLSLQEREAPFVATRFLKDARDRIQSLSAVHERLYSSSDYSSIDLSEYAIQVVSSLFSSFGNPTIQFEPDCIPLEVTLDEAIPCGLILNEAVTNVLKYAFPSGWTGPRRIALRIGIGKGGERYIEIRDNGAGTVLDLNSSQSLGCTIMRLSSQQLGGNLSITSETGTRVLVNF
jgi:PAS domain S-box-containing protein